MCLHGSRAFGATRPGRCAVGIATFLLACACVAFPQSAPPSRTSSKAAPAPSPLAPETLVRRAYALAAQMKPTEKALALERLASESSRMPADFTRALADDLSQLVPQLPAAAQSEALDRAISAMAAVDPERAIAMLLAVDPPRSSENWETGASDPRDSATQMLFEELWRQRGAAAAPELRQLALSLGQRGFYPYHAAGTAIARIEKSDDAVAWFNEATDYYVNQPQKRWLDSDFHGFLRPLTWTLPRPAVRRAYEALVHNLLAAAESDSSPGEQVSTNKGSVQLNRVEAGFWQMTAILRVISPELEQQVADERPNIAQVKAITDGATWQQVNFLDRKPYTATQDDIDEAMPAPRADSDTAAAKADVANSSGADRVRVLLSMAASAKANDPAKAASYLNDATDAAGKLDNPKQQVALLTNIVESGEDISQVAVVRNSLQVAFPVGDQLLRKAMDDDPSLQHGEPSVVGQLARMVTAGMYVDPEFTASLIDQLSNPLAKALLLASAADVQFTQVAVRKAKRKVAPVKQ